MKTLMKTLLYVSILSALFTCNLFSKENNIKYSIALVGMSMDYKEYDSSKTLLDSENSSLGKIAGYDMSFGYLFNKTNFSIDEAAMNVSMLRGKSDYVGAVLGSGNPYGSVKATTTNRFIDTSFSYKHTERYQNYFNFSYGLGVGYHAWYRELSSIQSELYEWYSLRPLIGITYAIDKFSFGLYGEYQYGFHTTMTSSNPSIKVQLGGADVLEVGFPLRYNYSKDLEFFTQYVLTKQNIKESNHVNTTLNGSAVTAWEPDSTSYQNYLKIGATFKF